MREVFLKRTLPKGATEKIFHEVHHSEELGLRNPHQLRMFCLDITNTKFSYTSLKDFLIDCVGYYVFDRAELKKHVRNRYNDGNVKGTIDVARHIEQNTPFTGNVAYSQREFSYDNNLMELVRHTIEFIKGKPYGNNLLIRVKDEVKLVVEATPRYEQYDRQKIIEANKKNSVRHAYFREYRALQRLCLLILQHQKHQIGSGSRQIYGILFDGAWLWEEYVSSLIDDAFYHPMNKGGTGAQRLFGGNIMQRQCPSAVLMGVTFHRGTQRSYIFVVHPEHEKMYRNLVKGFLRTAWNNCFTDEFPEMISEE